MQPVLPLSDLPVGAKKTVTLGETEILLLNHEGTILALQSKCPHAGAPLEKGAVCNGRLVCPWHMGTFALPSGALVEPPPMAPLKRYPVEISGDTIHVSPDPLPATDPAQKLDPPAPSEAKNADPRHDARRFVLVGAGAAGAMAARTLRLSGYQGTITAIDPIPNEPVDRTLLSKFALSGQKPLSAAPLGTLAEDRVDRITAAVTALNAARGELTLSTGDTLPYDAALVATGGIPSRPDLPGQQRAFTIRHTSDLEAIFAAAPPASNVVILGASFIGMEAAGSLLTRGHAVTVLCPSPIPFAEKFGDRIGTAILDLHRSSGVQFRLNAHATEITPTSVRVQSEEQPDGQPDGQPDRQTEEIPADLVLLGVGVTPTLSFTHDLPLAPEKNGKPDGIAVSPSLQAGPSTWVAGDIANVDGIRIEHWRLAEQHGMLAARAMLGEPDTFTGVPFFWTAHFGKRLGYLGHSKQWDRIVYDGDPATFRFLSFFEENGKVAAILGCGRDTDLATLAETMRAQPTLAECQAAIAP